MIDVNLFSAGRQIKTAASRAFRIYSRVGSFGFLRRIARCILKGDKSGRFDLSRRDLRSAFRFGRRFWNDRRLPRDRLPFTFSFDKGAGVEII